MKKSIAIAIVSMFVLSACSPLVNEEKKEVKDSTVSITKVDSTVVKDSVK